MVFMSSSQGDGTLNSLISRFFVVAFVLFFSGQGCLKENSNDISICFEKESGLTVVRVDENNHRLFAITKPFPENELSKKISNAASCFKTVNWSGDWSISLFADKKYAGYKDEKEIIPYHKDNEWAKSYVGEYDGSSGGYKSFPAL